MAAGPSSNTPIVTVEGVSYLIKVGGAKWSSPQSKYMEWYVVAFACDPDGQNAPLAGPFGTKSEAAEALQLYSDRTSGETKASEIIRAARASL